MLISNVSRISGVPLALVSVAMIGVAIAPPTTAQVPIIDGRVVYENTAIFVPNTNTPNDFRTTQVFEGQQPTGLRIQTPQGPIPNNAIFRPSADPRLFTQPGEIPRIGDRGEQFGTLTFRSFTSNGNPAIFTNIPTRLDFQVINGNLTEAGPYTRYGLPAVSITETGTVTTDATITTAERTLNIVSTQYQPCDCPPTDQQVNGQTVPAAAYEFQASGLAYRADFEAALLNTGTIDIPNSPGFNATGSPNPNAPDGGIEIFVPPVLAVPEFNRPPANNPPGLGGDQSLPILPDLISSLDLNAFIFSFVAVVSNVWFDPPAAESFTFTMKPGQQPVGMASRVFPGLSGQQQRTSLFTAISGLPKGIDADDRYTVTVEGVVLGEFSADQTIDFRDFRAQLGDRLHNGQGVRTFVISGIEPGVNAANPRAFPIKLAFNTPTASFDMQAAGLP